MSEITLKPEGYYHTGTETVQWFGVMLFGQPVVERADGYEFVLTNEVLREATAEEAQQYLDDTMNAIMENTHGLKE